MNKPLLPKHYQPRNLDRCNAMPTEEEIAAACKAIRAKWGATDKRLIENADHHAQVATLHVQSFRNGLPVVVA